MQAVRRYHPRVEGYLTLEQLAEFLGVKSTGSLRVQIQRGAINAERIGKRTFLVSVEEAERYKRERRAGPGHPTKQMDEEIDADARESVSRERKKRI